MASWYLLNTTRMKGPNGATVLSAGELINDALTPTAPILSAGGQLVPSTNAAAAAGAVIATKKKKQGAQPTEIDAIMIAAVAASSSNEGGNVASSQAVAGGTVVAAAAITPNVAYTPKSSPNATVKSFFSFAPLASGTIRVLLKQGATVIAALGTYTGAAGAPPFNGSISLEVTGLVPGTAATFSLVTTAGDATATLGTGSTGAAAGLSVTEHP